MNAIATLWIDEEYKRIRHATLMPSTS